MQLSEHFTLEELTHSDTATKLGIKNEPNDIEIGHLRMLCVYILEPLRQAWGSGIAISSGFRCEKLNNKVGGSKTSAHRFGYAADIVPSNGKMKDFKAFVKAYIQVNGKAFDQCIDEKKGSSEWIHIGLISPAGEQRRQFLITTDGKNYKTDKV